MSKKSEVSRTTLDVSRIASELKRRECPRCRYATHPDGRCTNLVCENWADRTDPGLYHGRPFGRWILDCERWVLVDNGHPTVRRCGDETYIAFLGGREIDLERVAPLSGDARPDLPDHRFDLGRE